MPNSRFALHRLAPPRFTVCALFLPLIHGLCVFSGPPLGTCLDSPLSAGLSVHGLHFTVYAPSIQYKILLRVAAFAVPIWALMSNTV